MANDDHLFDLETIENRDQIFREVTNCRLFRGWIGEAITGCVHSYGTVAEFRELVHDSNVGDGVLLNPATIAVPPGAVTVFQYGFNTLFTDLSNEIRLTSSQNQRLRWVVGANNIQADQQIQVTAAFVAGGATFPLAPTYISDEKTATYGIFGGFYLDIVPNLTLTFEARYQWDNLSSTGATRPSVTLQQLYTSFQPRTSLEYKIAPDMMVYASYASGTRPGGFNSILVGQSAYVINQISAQTGQSNPAYQQESLNTYEVGFKGDAFNDRVNWALDGYYGTLTNMQISQTVNYMPASGGEVGVDIISNLGRVRIYGAEAEGAWRVLPDLTATATFAYNQTDILKYVCTACLPTIGTTNVDGNELPLAPTYSGSLALDYTHPITEVWRGFGHLDIAYRGRRWMDFENLAYIRSYEIANLRLGATRGPLRLEAYIDNLTDNTTLVGAQRLNDTIDNDLEFRAGLPLKRTFGARARYSF
jgi:iron complex outermembrane receptor protein